MKILGLDPGQTSGWCLYDTDLQRAVSSGIFTEHRVDSSMPSGGIVVVERPKGYGKTFPQVVDCGYVAGRLAERFDFGDGSYRELTRIEVRQTLQGAVHGVVHVKNDATAWAAIKILHGGEGCDKKGGPLHGVKSHGRAALAVAVALSIRMAAESAAVGGAA